ncbi:hypothetical protein [Propionicicella superfundia]|uniref:hypothetical protein n=1 Tax=Propionicicella superfundia TaxID=348582 RepID=UPI0004202F1F|nr:hypothetical protein [Propionicicella superfundia]
MRHITNENTDILAPPPLSATEQQAIRYQQIVTAYDPAAGCTCTACRTIAVLIRIPINT